MQNKYLDDLLAKHGHLVQNKWNAPEDSTYIGRGSLYGNPILLTNPKDPQERIEVILQFKDYLTHRLQEDPIFAGAVKSLKGRDLKCYCSNGKSSLDEVARHCHGLILLHAAELLHLHDSLSDVVSVLKKSQKSVKFFSRKERNCLPVLSKMI